VLVTFSLEKNHKKANISRRLTLCRIMSFGAYFRDFGGDFFTDEYDFGGDIFTDEYYPMGQK